MTFDTTGIPAILWERFEAIDFPSTEWHFVVEEESPYFQYQCRNETSRPIEQAFLTPVGGVTGLVRNLPEAIRYCMAAHWRGIRLVATLRELDGRCSWPGGYDAPAIYAANQKYWEAEYGEQPSYVDVDGMPGIDPRFVLQDDTILEDLESLRNYPCLDAGLAGEIELGRQDEAWNSWAESEWRDAVQTRLADAIEANLPESDHTTDPDSLADDLLDGKDEELAELFRYCCEQSGTYWEEESDGSQYVDFARVAGALDLADLRDLSGLPLLPPDQQWRRESYPWPDGSTDPLVPPLVV